MSLDVKPPRSWREIAQLTCTEQDSRKVLEFAQELIRALDAEYGRYTTISSRTEQSAA